MHRTPLLRAAAVCAPCLLAASLGAQSPTDPTRIQPDLRGLQEWMRPALVERTDGELIATQAEWKALFATDGVTFSPTLGADASKALPVRFSFLSVGRDSGGRAGTAAGTGGPEPVLAKQTVHYERGAGIHELFEVREEGLKHSVVFDRRPEGSGDLRVRIALESELTAPEGIYSGSLSLRLGRQDVVGIGAVLGIDAEGHRQPGWLDYRGDYIDLVLPAHFVDAAAYPLTLDPLIGSLVQMGGGSGAVVDPDVSYDLTTDTFLVVWARRAAPQDHDIFAQRIRLDGTLVGSRVSVATATFDTYSPRVANVNVRNAFYVVWEYNSHDPAQGREIYGRAVRASDGALGVGLQIRAGLSSGGALTQEGIQPDVCGDWLAQDDECLVVFADPHDGIHSREITVAADLSSSDGATRRRQITGDASARNPAISNSCGQGRVALVAWETVSGRGYVRAITMDSTLRSAAIGIDVPWNRVTQLSVDGNGTTFLLVGRWEVPAGSDPQIFTVGIGLPSDPQGTPYALSLPFRSIGDPAVEDSMPSVALASNSANAATDFYAVHFKQGDPQVREDSYIQRVNGLGDPCGPVDLVRNFSSSSKITSTYAGGRVDDDRALAVIFDGNIIGAHAWEAFGNGGPVLDLGGRVGQGGTLSGVGDFALGNPDFRLDLVGAYSGRSGTTYACFSFTGAPTSVPCGGGRLITNAPVCIPLSFVNGAVSTPLAVSCDPNLIGFGLSVQFLSITPGDNSCGGLSASNMLSMTIGR